MIFFISSVFKIFLFFQVFIIIYFTYLGIEPLNVGIIILENYYEGINLIMKIQILKVLSVFLEIHILIQHQLIHQGLSMWKDIK